MDDKIMTYVGKMKQPMDSRIHLYPTMFEVADNNLRELFLILLTPGCFRSAYNYIRSVKPVSVTLFIPSLRWEWISDIFNLYMSLRGTMPIAWVYPKKVKHDDFDHDEIVSNNYIHPFEPSISVQYISNEHEDDVYDIVIQSSEGYQYFSQYLDEEKLDELYNDSSCKMIHIPYSSTIYGGLNYKQAIDIHRKYLYKLEPHSFTSYYELDQYIRQRKGE